MSSKVCGYHENLLKDWLWVPCHSRASGMIEWGRDLMTPRQFITTLRRRWYVLAIAALCTAVGMAAVHKHPVVYQACDELFVTPPPTNQAPNVYTGVASSTAVTTGIVTRAVNSSAVQAQLRAAGLTAAYDAEMTNTGSNENPAYDEPTVQVCAT